MKRPELQQRVVARGTWFYNHTVPFLIEVRSRPVEFAGSRFIEDEHGEFIIDEHAPIPNTPDCLVYSLSLGAGREFKTLTDAKNWADAQPWGPVIWEESPK